MQQKQGNNEIDYQEGYPYVANDNNSQSQSAFNQQTEHQKYIGVFPEFYSLKTHNKGYAFEIKPTLSKKGFITVNIEGAKAFPSTSNSVKYDWKNRTTIQISNNELADCIMTLLGMKKHAKFQNHKVGSISKSLEMEFQPGGVYIKLNRHHSEDQNKSLYVRVKIPTVEALAAGHLALVQYCQNFPTLTPDAVLKTFEYSIKNERYFAKKQAIKTAEKN